MAYHMDVPVGVQFTEDAINVIGKMNPFEKMEYQHEVVNVGPGVLTTAPKKDGSTFDINVGERFKYTMSEALHGRLVEESILSGDVAEIKMLKIDGYVNYSIDKKEGEGKPIPPPKSNGVSKANVNGLDYGYRSVKDRDTSKSDEIKWGLSMKLAVEICASDIADIVGTEENPKEVQVMDRVALYTHNLFRLANHLPDFLETEAEKPAPEPSDKNDDEDLPF